MHNNSKHLTHPKYRSDIDGLRAIAVIAVVAFHAFPYWIKGGFTGVDIFFVISGFLISTIIFENLERDSFSFVEFYSRRVKRIFPALLVVLITSIILGWFFLMPSEFAELGRQITGGTGFVANLLFWSEAGYFDNTAILKPLLHLWSLGVEEQFYVVWPLLLWLATKRRINLLLLALILAIASFGLNIHLATDDSVNDFYSPLTRFWELATGALLAWFELHKNDSPQWLKYTHTWLNKISGIQTSEAAEHVFCNCKSVLGFLLLIVSIFIITEDKIFPGWWAILPVLGAVLIISAGMQGWVNRTILSSRILVWFGLISFPLYLWHWLLLSFSRIIETDTPSREMRIATILASILLAWFTYNFVERPIRFGSGYKNTKTLALLMSMIIVGTIGYSTYRADGWDFRYPATLNALTLNNYDFKTKFRDETCFLEPAQNYESFDNCQDHLDENKQTIFIWGDSHAADLYSGYKDEYGNKFNIIQRTASSCPPILGMEITQRKFCQNINNYDLKLIEKNKPEKIVLAAVWGAYDWEKVGTTISQLKKDGFNNIDLIGPAPIWNDGLPKEIYESYKTDPLHRIPTRMTVGLRRDTFKLDKAMSAFAKENGVNYISPLAILCDSSGCLTRLGNTEDTLTAFDYGHLTARGAEFVVARFPKN